MKTYDLIGTALDWAVAKAENEIVEIGDVTSAYVVIGKCLEWPGHTDDFGIMCYAPSTDWSIGGPIIERELITLEGDTTFKEWRAIHPKHYAGPPYASAGGETLLIAGMRAFVRSQLGDEIDIPEELING
jgi:hypothetical protein